MTTAADDTTDEAAFEAFLLGRPAPEEAADSFAAVAAFAGAVRATATTPGRPNAALAELLATGRLTDQSSPSIRTAPSAGGSPRRPRVRIRRRFAMIFPALIAKFLAAGAVAQAATGAGIVVVAFTGAGATGVLGDDVQDSITSLVGTTDESTTDDAAATGDDQTKTDDLTGADPGTAEVPEAETSVPVEPEFDAQAWVEKGPEGYASFGAWVSDSAQNADLREWLRAEGRTFGSMVSEWAHKKGMDDADLAEEGVNLDELTDDSVTPEPTEDAETESDDAAESSKVKDDAKGNGGGHGNGGGNGNSGRGHN